MNGGALPAAVRDLLGDVAGRRVLHFGCGDGEATVELAALGALVTGIDADERALAAARARDPDLPWLHGDAEHLPAELQRGRMDVVLAGPRSLAGARDLERWAAGLAVVLHAGGELVVEAQHPAAAHFDEVLRWRGDYFAPDAPPGVGDVVTAVARAGLVVRRLQELPDSPPLRPQAAKAPGRLLLLAARPG